MNQTRPQGRFELKYFSLKKNVAVELLLGIVLDGLNNEDFRKNTKS
jgi:hypothetical protein